MAAPRCTHTSDALSSENTGQRPARLRMIDRETPRLTARSGRETRPGVSVSPRRGDLPWLPGRQPRSYERDLP